MFDLAIYARMVGGFIGTGSTTLGRLRWALTIGCYMAFVSVVHHQQWVATASIFVLCALGTFLGRLIPHAAFQATASLFNSLGMAAVNATRVFLIVVPYAVINWNTVYSDPFAVRFDLDRLLLALLGIMAGVAYYVGNKWLDNLDSGIYFRNTHSQWRIADTGIAVGIDPSLILDQAAVAGSEWGELLTGWFVYELMFITALVLA